MAELAAVRSAIRNLAGASVGDCPICGGWTLYLVTNRKNPRWGFQCLRCRSVPRNRMAALALAETLGVHSLPEARRRGLQQEVYIAAASGYLLKALPVGTPRLRTSEFVPGVPPGQLLSDGHSTCQDLGRLTYADESLDLVVTEDVFEHLRHPDACLDEIRRVLRPGGRHIFTVPFTYDRPTVERVDTSGPEDVLLMEEEWHGDSIRDRILAYRNVGYDVFDLLRKHGFESRLMLPTLENRRAGVIGAEAFVTTKV